MVGLDFVNNTPKQAKKQDTLFIKVISGFVFGLAIFTPLAAIGLTF